MSNADVVDCCAVVDFFDSSFEGKVADVRRSDDVPACSTALERLRATAATDGDEADTVTCSAAAVGRGSDRVSAAVARRAAGTPGSSGGESGWLGAERGGEDVMTSSVDVEERQRAAAVTASMTAVVTVCSAGWLGRHRADAVTCSEEADIVACSAAAAAAAGRDPGGDGGWGALLWSVAVGADCSTLGACAATCSKEEAVLLRPAQGSCDANARTPSQVATMSTPSPASRRRRRRQLDEASAACEARLKRGGEMVALRVAGYRGYSHLRISSHYTAAAGWSTATTAESVLSDAGYFRRLRGLRRTTREVQLEYAAFLGESGAPLGPIAFCQACGVLVAGGASGASTGLAAAPSGRPQRQRQPRRRRRCVGSERTCTGTSDVALTHHLVSSKLTRILAPTTHRSPCRFAHVQPNPFTNPHIHSVHAPPRRPKMLE